MSIAYTIMWQRSWLGVAAFALGVLGAPGNATAQSSAKAFRIGWLGNSVPPEGSSQGVADFEQALREFGYVAGRNLTIVYRYGNGDANRLAEHAAEFARIPVDLIVTSGERAAEAARRATTAIPVIVTEIAVDPVKQGLVSSLGRPGGNITGFTTLSDELWLKRIGLVKEVKPSISRLTVLWNPGNPGNKICLDEIRAAATTMRVQVRDFEVPDFTTLGRARAAIAKDPPDAITACWDSVTVENAKSIADLALKLRIPTLAPIREYVQAGWLMSEGASLPVERRHAARYVDKILKGAKPANLPVEQPDAFPLVVNRTTAKAIGITMPAAFGFAVEEWID